MAGMEAYLSGSTRIRFREKDPAGWERFAALFRAHSATGSANTLRGFQGRRPSLYTREADLAQVNVPLLIVCGDEDDPCVGPSLFLRRTVPNSGLAMLPHTGHACNLEEPAVFNGARRRVPRTGRGREVGAAPRGQRRQLGSVASTLVVENGERLDLDEVLRLRKRPHDDH